VLKKKRLNELSYEILDSTLIVAIMTSCATSISIPECRQFQKCSLMLYHMCLYNDFWKVLNNTIKLWFTGKDFEDKHYGEKFFEEIEQRFSGKPGGWRRPPRICKNIELLKQANQWMKDKYVEYGIPQIILETDEDIKRAKELIPTLPDELKPLNVIRMIRNLPGWIKMDSPEMRKEVVYFMVHLMRTAWGAEVMRRTRKLYDLDQYMSWHVAMERICDGTSVEHQADFYNYCVKIYKKKLMKKTLSTSNSGSTKSIIDSLMGSTESVLDV